MQTEDQLDINHQVTTILLKKIIELLGTKDEPLKSLEVDNLDVVEASLQNNLSKQTSAIKSDITSQTKALTEALGTIKTTSEQQKEVINNILAEIKKSLTDQFASVYVKKPVDQVEILNLEDIPTEQRITNLAELEPYFNKLAEDLVGALRVEVASPMVNVPAPIVNLPETVVNVPPVYLDDIITALNNNLNKIRTNSETRPLAVRLSDGQSWIKELKILAEKQTQALAFPGPMVLKSADGRIINPATDESLKGVSPLSGVSVNGTRDLTSANTWYAVPSTVPSAPYVLIITIENNAGTVRWGFDNTGTPSATNGNLAPGELILRLAGGQVVYYSSSTAGDDINWTTKVI